MRSNLWLILAQASTIAVELLSITQALIVLARSPPGTHVGGWKLMPTCHDGTAEKLNCYVNFKMLTNTMLIYRV